MTNVRTLAVSLLALVASAGCRARGHDPKEEQTASTVSHDAQLLGKLLRLPAPPLDVAFEEVPLGTPGGFGPTDYALVAVLRFAPAVVAKLTTADAASGTGGSPAVTVQAWFPDAVKARGTSAGDAGFVVHGRTLDAASMFRPRYSFGSAVLIEGTDYVVLVAQTT